MDEETYNKILTTDALQENKKLEEYFVPKISVEIPTNFSVKVRNRQEFREIQYYYEQLGLNFEFEIVGCNGEYEAVFFIGPKPSVIINKIRKSYEK